MLGLYRASVTSPGAEIATPAGATRSIVFRSLANFRDLGGLPTGNGHVIRRGCLFRSASLHMATDHAAAQLDRLGIVSVLDLRTDHERERWPAHGAWTPRSVSHVPMLHKTWDRNDLDDYPDAGQFLASRYFNMLTDATVEIANAIHLIADAPTSPAVFHCSAGKDRTGVLAAIVLGLLGVDDDSIADDYELTAAAMPDVRRLFVDSEPTDASAMVNQPAAFLAVPRDAMTMLLQRVRAEWGSMVGYVHSIGVDRDVVAGLRNHMVR
jgi:protein-tyrosine phosphatase